MLEPGENTLWQYQFDAGHSTAYKKQSTLVVAKKNDSELENTTIAHPFNSTILSFMILKPEGSLLNKVERRKTYAKDKT